VTVCYYYLMAETSMNDEEYDGAVDYPVDGILDLHMFKPAEARSVVDEYLRVCRERGIQRVRVIPGKGQGVLRRMVQSELACNSAVRSFSTADDASGWGATIVELAPREPDK